MKSVNIEAQSWNNKRFENKIVMVWDTETTGVTSDDRICEIGIIARLNGKPVVVDGKEIEDFRSLVNPCRNIPKEASDIHGLTNQDVANAPKFEEIYRPVIDYIVSLEILEIGAFNSGFDTQKFDEEMARLPKYLPDLKAYLTEKHPDYIPFKFRQYEYNPQTQSYSYFGKSMRELTEEDELKYFVDCFPSVDYAPAFVGSIISHHQGGGTVGESLNSVLEQLNVDASSRYDEQGNEVHEALIDVRLTYDCYRVLAQRNWLEMPVMECLFQLEGKESWAKLFKPEPQPILSSAVVYQPKCNRDPVLTHEREKPKPISGMRL